MTPISHSPLEPAAGASAPLPLRSGARPVDFNHLYHREQVSMMRAAAAACAESRASHQGLADGYGRVIAFQRSLRAAPVMGSLPAGDDLMPETI